MRHSSRIIAAGMSAPSVLRALLIAVFALFGGPVPVTAGGQAAVICGASGAARAVAYDFRAGRPLPPSPGVRACDKCLVAAVPPEAEFSPPAAPRRIAERVAPSRGPQVSPRRVAAAFARGPPTA